MKTSNTLSQSFASATAQLRKTFAFPLSAQKNMTQMVERVWSPEPWQYARKGSAENCFWVKNTHGLGHCKLIAPQEDALSKADISGKFFSDVGYSLGFPVATAVFGKVLKAGKMQNGAMSAVPFSACSTCYNESLFLTGASGREGEAFTPALRHDARIAASFLVLSAFDLWGGNIDHHEQNLIVAYEKSRPMFAYGIDYQEMGVADYQVRPESLREEQRLALSVFESSAALNPLKLALNVIENCPQECLSPLANRLMAYADEQGKALVKIAPECLMVRRQQVRPALQELLPSKIARVLD